MAPSAVTTLVPFLGPERKKLLSACAGLIASKGVGEVTSKSCGAVQGILESAISTSRMVLARGSRSASFLGLSPDQAESGPTTAT